MITLTILDLKSKKTNIVVIASLDEARETLESVITDPKKAEGVKRGKYLDGYSFDDDSEKALIEKYLPESRVMTGEKKK